MFIADAGAGGYGGYPKDPLKDYRHTGFAGKSGLIGFMIAGYILLAVSVIFALFAYRSECLLIRKVRCGCCILVNNSIRWRVLPARSHAVYQRALAYILDKAF